MSDADHPSWITDALLLLMAVIWGVNYSVVKYAAHILTPGTFTFLRVVVAAVTLMSVAAVQRKPWPPMRDLVILASLGIIGNGMYQLLFVNGVSRTRVADAALIIAAAPASIAALSTLHGIERIHWRTAAGIALSILGVGIVILGSAHIQQREGSALGAALMIGAVLCWSIFTVALRRYALRIDPVQLNAATMVGGILPLLIWAPSVTRIAWSALPTAVWGGLFYSGAVSMGLAYLFWFRGLRLLGPTRTAIYGNLQPIVAILVAWALLRETPTLWQGAGAATIIGGILLTRS